MRSHTVCGLLMHSALAITTEGLPLGLSAVKVWSRKKFKGTAALKRRVNLTRLPNEISYSDAGISVRDIKELWNMPVVFLWLLLLMAAEWLLRRKWGVV